MFRHIAWSRAKTATVLLGSLVCTTGTAWNYARTLQSETVKKLGDLTPLSFQLARLDTAIKAIEPQIAANREAEAQLDTEITIMQRDIESRSQLADASQCQMVKLRADLATDKTCFEYDGRSFTRKDLERELARRLDRFKQNESSLANMRTIARHNEDLLAESSDRIRELEFQRDALVDKHHGLVGELAAAEAAGTRGDFRFDQSSLTEANRLAIEVEKRVRTLYKVASYRRLDGFEIPVPQDGRDILARYDERFGTPHPQPAYQH